MRTIGPALSKVIIRYFNQKQVVKTGLLDKELIAQGVQYVTYGTKTVFSSSVRVKNWVYEYYQAAGQMNFDGRGVYLSLEYNGNQANWYFRDCERE